LDDSSRAFSRSPLLGIIFWISLRQFLVVIFVSGGWNAQARIQEKVALLNIILDRSSPRDTIIHMKIHKALLLSSTCGVLLLPFVGIAQTGSAVPQAPSVLQLGAPVISQGDVKVYGAVGKSFVLDGSRSIDDAGSVAWEQVEGPKVSIENTTDAKITVVPTVAGTYVFLLHARSGSGEHADPRRYVVTVSGDGDGNKVPPPPPPPRPSGDPDFDLNTVAPKSDSPLYEDKSLTENNPMYESHAKGDVSTGTSLQARMTTKTQISRVGVQGWDPKKKEEFMQSRKAHAEVASQQDLEHFAQGILLDDESIDSVSVEPNRVSISYRTEGKFLGMFRLTYGAELSGETSDGVETKYALRKPWWSFVVTGDESSDSVVAKVKKKEKETIRMDSVSWGVSQYAGLLVAIHATVSRHDTAKNTSGTFR
jgi:hypothetical protein